jgi:outer membrane autotransporter protein
MKTKTPKESGVNWIIRSNQSGQRGSVREKLSEGISWSVLPVLLLTLLLVTTASTVFAQPFTVTLEAPKIQVSSLFTNPGAFGAANVFEETFNELSPGFHSSSFPFAQNSALGSYDHGQIQPADQFGGAGGTGNYLTVNSTLKPASNPTTLTFSTPQRYFGLWWSAGDANNVLKFYSGNTLLSTFTTSDVINFINSSSNKSQYFGNPNNGKDSGEPFAFINFFASPTDPNLTFNRVVFSNQSSSSGFEQDNDTIAGSYISLSGTAIPTTPTPVEIAPMPGTTGTLSVPGGTLTVPSTIVGDGGDGMLTVTDGGTLNSGTTTIANAPGSSGTAVVNGPGSTINGGDTTVGNGGNGSLIITDGGVVNDTNTTVAKQSGSTGDIVVNGSGSELNNTGTLDVGPAGLGIVDITNGGVVTADDGATIGPTGVLTGNGTIMAPTVINNGTVAPSGPNNTPGTLTVNGNYEQGPTGTLETEFGGQQSSQADQLKVTGTAALDGTLALTSLNNFHPASGDTYTVLTANDGVTGNFTKVVDTLNNSGLTRTNIIAPNGVIVAYLRPVTPVVSQVPPASLVLSTTDPVPTTPLTNQQKNAILVPVVNPNVEQLAAPFDIWFSLANTQRFNLEARFDDVIAGSTGFVSNITPALPPTGKEVVGEKGVASGKEEAPPSPSARECRWGVWVTGYGDFVNVDSEGPAKGYDYTNGGVTVGADYRVTDHFLIGIMGGYAHTWTDLKPSGSVGVDTGWGGLYVGYFNEGFYVLGAAFGGGNTFDTTRAALVGPPATGSSDSQELSTFLSGGYDFHFKHLTIGPTVAMQYSYMNISGFSEQSSIAPVKVSEDSEESWRTDLGVRAWYNFQVGRVGVRPFGRVAWEHEFEESALPVTARLVDIPGTPVTVFGPSLGHESAVVNAGIAVEWNSCFSTYVSYDGQLGREHYRSNGVSGGFKISF